MEVKEIAKRVADFYPEEKNILKVVEECMELSEVLVKSMTKAEGYKPGKAKVIEEMGDVLFRLRVLATFYGINEDVNQRVRDKAKQMNDYITEKSK